MDPATRPTGCPGAAGPHVTDRPAGLASIDQLVDGPVLSSVEHRVHSVPLLFSLSPAATVVSSASHQFLASATWTDPEINEWPKIQSSHLYCC